MPYILKHQRAGLEPRCTPETAGELNYAITRLVARFTAKHGLCYDTLNAVVGVLDSAKVEYQRRIVAPYEDEKLRDNGDVYAVSADQV